jgi:hypothetical protein
MNLNTLERFIEELSPTKGSETSATKDNETSEILETQDDDDEDEDETCFSIKCKVISAAIILGTILVIVAVAS